LRRQNSPTERRSPTSELSQAGERGLIALASADTAELVDMRRQLSMALPALQTQVEDLDERIRNTTQGLRLEREKLRVLDNRKQLVSLRNVLKTRAAPFRRQIAEIEDQEALALGTVTQRINDWIIDNILHQRVGIILATNNPTIIRTALDHMTSIHANGVHTEKYYKDGADRTRTWYSYNDSHGETMKLQDFTFEYIKTALEKKLSQLRPNEKNEEVRGETFAQRLANNRTHQDLLLNLKPIAEELSEVEAQLAGLNGYMYEWRTQLESPIKEQIAKCQAEEDRNARKVTRITDVFGSLGVIGGGIVAIVDVATTGGLISAGSLAFAIASRIITGKKLKFTPLTEEEVQAQARILCETKINELEQSLVNLSERRREAILALKEEEREIRQLTDGNGSGE
jgi:hypothetical protein